MSRHLHLSHYLHFLFFGALCSVFFIVLSRSKLILITEFAHAQVKLILWLLLVFN